MDTQKQLIELLEEHKPKAADAIVLLAGDRFHRVPRAAELFHAHYAPRIVITSNANDHAYGSLPASTLAESLRALEVPSEHVMWEETAPHTRAEADSTLRLAREYGWKKLLIVTTKYHQYRAFLTWVRAMYDEGMDIELVMVSVLEFPDFYDDTEDDAMAREFEKIKLYGEKGHVATYEEGIEYLLRNR